MQSQSRQSNRIVQQSSNIPIETQSNVTRSVSRVPGHYQYEATATFRSDYDGDEFDNIG
jgi:hypothetical protein